MEKENLKDKGSDVVIPHLDRIPEEILAFRKSLPIANHAFSVINSLSTFPFLVLTGQTGSGKSTQLPQYLRDFYSQGPAKKDLSVVVTQPRRLAAISMAKRLCHERGVILGEEVGYTIRFDNKTSEKTRISYVTDGVLVRECLHDELLLKYDVVILDEAHERSLDTDVLFALVKKAVQKRNKLKVTGTRNPFFKPKMSNEAPNLQAENDSGATRSLQVIVTSATLPVEKFADFFWNCPTIEVSGRCYPVEIGYEAGSGNRVEDAVQSAIRLHLHEGPGDILVFLTGSEECEAAVQLMNQKLIQFVSRGGAAAPAFLYSLYGAKSSEEQTSVFEPAEKGSRKIIFSTNIAETSVTIDGIGFVIDSGFSKQKVYNARSGMESLVVMPVSKVRVIQRTGRAGRTQAGKCIRLYSEGFFLNEMRDTSEPEVLRVNLANLILFLKMIGIQDVFNFDFMDRPPDSMIILGLKHLFLLGGIDQEGELTQIGKEMSKFPLEPMYSKALLVSKELQCTHELITIVSLLSTEGIWQKFPGKSLPELQSRLEESQVKWISKNKGEGDHMMLVRVFEHVQKLSSKPKKELFCKENNFSSRALLQAENIVGQLSSLMKGIRWEEITPFLEKEPIFASENGQRLLIEGLEVGQRVRMALSSGLFLHTARLMVNSFEDYFVIIEESAGSLDPSSEYAITKKHPRYLVFSELAGLNNSKGQMRICSRVEEEWVRDYLSKRNEVDLGRLAKIEKKAEKEEKETKLLEKRERSQVEEGETQKNQSKKVEEAKMRAISRKKKAMHKEGKRK